MHAVCVHRLLQETSTAVAENLRKQFSGLAGTLHATLLQRDSLSWAVQQTLQQQVTECSTYPLHAPVRVFLLCAWHPCKPINGSKVMLTANCRSRMGIQRASRSRQSSCGATVAASQWRQDLPVHPESSRRAMHVAQAPHRGSRAGSL